MIARDVPASKNTLAGVVGRVSFGRGPHVRGARGKREVLLGDVWQVLILLGQLFPANRQALGPAFACLGGVRGGDDDVLLQLGAIPDCPDLVHALIERAPTVDGLDRSAIVVHGQIVGDARAVGCPDIPRILYDGLSAPILAERPDDLGFGRHVDRDVAVGPDHGP